MSKIHNFTTAIPAGDPTPYKFVVYGDMGITPFPRGTTTADFATWEVEKNEARFIFHHGDISYAMGYVSDVYEYVNPYCAQSFQKICQNEN